MIASASNNSALLAVWIVFAGVVLAGVAAVLVWAVRSGQFSHQDRARRLPLDSGIPQDRPAPAATPGPAAAQSQTAAPRPAMPEATQPRREEGGRDNA